MFEGYSWSGPGECGACKPDLDTFFGIDTPGIGAVLAADRPDAVIITGWQSLSLIQGLWACMRLRAYPLSVRAESNAMRARPLVGTHAAPHFVCPASMVFSPSARPIGTFILAMAFRRPENPGSPAIILSTTCASPRNARRSAGREPELRSGWGKHSIRRHLLCVRRQAGRKKARHGLAARARPWRWLPARSCTCWWLAPVNRWRRPTAWWQRIASR